VPEIVHKASSLCRSRSIFAFAYRRRSPRVRVVQRVGDQTVLTGVLERLGECVAEVHEQQVRAPDHLARFFPILPEQLLGPPNSRPDLARPVAAQGPSDRPGDRDRGQFSAGAPLRKSRG
jgi:hypothetical protein